MYHAQIVPTAMIPEVRTLTALWVSFTISLVVLHVDLDPQQRVVEPTNDDLGRFHWVQLDVGWGTIVVFCAECKNGEQTKASGVARNI